MFYLRRRSITKERVQDAKGGLRINHAIQAKEVRLVDEEGQMLGVMTVASAIEAAAAAGLDLVEISPQAEPPVCKIIDYGKYKYQAQKRKAEAKKKQKVIEIKEIKMRPVIDVNDYNTKMRSVQRFIDEGDKVKITLRFKGREITHQEVGVEVLKRVEADSAPYAVVEVQPRLEGRILQMMLGPKKTVV